MAIFNSYVKLPEGTFQYPSQENHPLISSPFRGAQRTAMGRKPSGLLKRASIARTYPTPVPKKVIPWLQGDAVSDQ